MANTTSCREEPSCGSVGIPDHVQKDRNRRALMTVCQTITEGVFATGREAARSCGRQRLRLIPTGAYCSAHFAGDENDGDGDNQKGMQSLAWSTCLLRPGPHEAFFCRAIEYPSQGRFGARS